MIMRKDYTSFLATGWSFPPSFNKYFKKVKLVSDEVDIAESIGIILGSYPGEGVIALNMNSNELILLNSEELSTIQTGGQHNQNYSQVEDKWIRKTKVAALDTIYKIRSEHLDSASGTKESYINYRIHAAEIPLTEAEEYNDNNPLNKSCPLFEEEKHLLPFGGKTIYDGGIGLIIASPVLFATDGIREFSISFYFNGDPFKKYFIDYAEAYGDVIKLSPRVIVSEIINNAFIIYITGLKGWIQISDYSVIYSESDKGKDGLDDWKEMTEYPDKVKNALLNIAFTLGKDDPVSISQPAIHGLTNEISMPVIKLILKNATSLHPNGFLFQQVIEKIAINVQVKDCVNLNLNNNIGKLSNSNPSQLFGPQPAIGSFIEIANSNIFNRFTKKASVKFKWVDLPRMIGGFHAYYKGYPKLFYNESFKIGFSRMIDGEYLPKRNDQEKVNLFEFDDNLLSETSSFDDILSDNIRFDNEPLLEKENISALDFPVGAIRIELLEPEDAFCQNIYPVILPEILIHNSKWYKKKLPLPNQPFIPIVSNVSVDYELEVTGKVVGEKLSVVKGDIELWHISGFELRKIYPCEIRE